MRKSGRVGLEQLVKRVGRHADGCLPHAAVAATNSSLNQRGRRHHGGTTMEPGVDVVPPMREGTLHAERVRRALTRAQ